MCKRFAALLLAVLLLAAVFPAAAEHSRFAVLYDGESEESGQILAAVQEYTIFAAWDCAYLDVCAPVDLSGFTSVILCLGAEEELPLMITQEIKERYLPVFIIGSGGLIQLAPEVVYHAGDVLLSISTEAGSTVELLLNHPGLWMMPEEGAVQLGGTAKIGRFVYPLCMQQGQVAHLAWFDPQEPLLMAQLANSLQAWQWPYENAPTVYGQYLVLNEVYPFLDPAEMMARTDALTEARMPYVLAVTPVFSNGEYPAMKRFCEYLRYEQSRGTGIIIRVPFVSLGQVELDELIHHMEVAYTAYAQYGVYPVGIQAPVSWMQSAKGLEALRGYRMVFLFETDDMPLTGQAENLSYRDGHQLIAPANETRQAFTASYAQAIYLDAQMEQEELLKTIERLKGTKRVFKGLRGVETAVYSGDLAVLVSQEGITVNGQRQDLTYIPFTYSEDYVFDRGITQYLKEQIETSNKWLVIFVVLACTVFSVMMWLFRRQVRRELVLGRSLKPQQPANKKK